MDLHPSILEANPLLIFEQRNISNEGFLFPVMDANNKHAKDKQGQLLFKTPYKNAFYNGLEFKIFENGTITINGSLHKYYNSGAHNYNDFNFSAFLGVLNDLKQKFSIDLNNCVLKCLEIGINITPPKPTNQILEYCFLHKTKNFEYRINSDEGKYKQCEHTQYIIKIYNKALHYKSKGFDINTEILRFEIKYTKMERLNKLGIYNLNDIAKIGFKYFENELITEWQNVLFYDNTIVSNSNRINNYKNPLYWCKLIENNSKTNYYKHKGILKELTSNNSDKVQSQITEIMRNKITFLSQEGASFDTLNIKSIHTPHNQTTNTINNNICEVTKVNISMQKDNSILLSHTGLKYYYKTDKKIYEQIKRSYLSKRWFNSNFEIQIKEIAHNIRNAKGNQKTKQIKIYQPQQVNLLSYLGL
jgi:hypothetical protein